MKYFLLILSLQAILYSFAQTSSDVINQSISFYSRSQSAKFKIKHFFKSSLRTSTDSSLFNGQYIKDDENMNARIDCIAGGWTYLELGKQSYLYDWNKKAFSIIKNKEIKYESGSQIIKSLPFIRPDIFFKDIYRSKCNLKVYNNSIVVTSTDNLRIFVFDKNSFQLLTYSIIVNTPNGVQYESWDITEYVPFNISKDYFLNLKDSLFQISKTGLNTKAQPQGIGKNEIGTQFPDFMIRTINGGIYTNESLKGKYVLFDFFYQSCLPCYKSIATLNKLRNTISANDLIIIGIDPVFDDTTDIKSFALVNEIKYEIVAGNDARTLWEIFRNEVYPSSLLLDPDGKIKWVETGFTKRYYHKIIRSIKK